MAVSNYWSKQRSSSFSRRQLIRLGAGGAGAAALLLAGCSSTTKNSAGNTASNSASNTASNAASNTASGSPAARATPASTPQGVLASLPENPPKDWSDANIKTGGTSTRLGAGAVPGLDPTQMLAGAAEVYLPVYNRLIRLANHQGMKSVQVPELEGDLAASWERPDPMTLVFKLAPNIKFQNVAPLNGRALTTDDIQYTLQRGKTYEKSAAKTFYSIFDRAEAVDPTTVRVVLAQPHPVPDQILGSYFCAIVPHEIGDSPDTIQSKAVGTGGFILDKFDPPGETILRRNPDYFKKDAQGRQKPYIDSHSYRIVTDVSTQQRLFEAGDVDTAYTTAAPFNVDNVEDFLNRQKNYIIQRKRPSYSSFLITGHYDTAPWSDVRFRRAVAMTFDRATIINTLFKGYGTASPYFPWPSLFDASPAGAQLGPYLQYNPQQARQLLSAAGFPNGTELTLDWWPSRDVAAQLQLWQAQAAPAGLKLNLAQNPDITAGTQKVRSRSWKDLIMDARDLVFIDPLATINYYIAGSSQNFSNVNDPELTALRDKYLAAKPEERKGLIQQIWERQIDQIYDVPLPRPDYFQPFHKRFKNFVDTSWNAESGNGLGELDSVWLDR